MAKIKKALVFALVLRLFLVLISGYHPDLLNHIDWGKKLWEYGPKNFYEQIFWGVSWPNQPFLSIYFFGLIAKIREIIFAGFWWLNIKVPLFPSLVIPYLEQNLHPILLKLPLIAADIGLGWLIYKIIFDLKKDEKKALFGSCLFLFNPALIYNSTIWGQTDSVLNLMVLAGIWCLWKNRFFWGCLLFVGSCFFKMSLIIWLPVVLLLLWQKRNYWPSILVSLASSLGIYLLLALPFVHHGNVFTWLIYMFENRILPRQGNMLSGNAFNFWTLIYGTDPSLKKDALFLGIKASFLGSFLAAGLSLLCLALFIKQKRKSFPDFLWLMMLLAFVSFLFLSNMHERYLYPVFAPFAILVALWQIRDRAYWLLSFFHLVNLYHLWWYPRIDIFRFLLEGDHFLASRLVSFLMILIFGFLFYNF